MSAPIHFIVPTPHTEETMNTVSSSVTPTSSLHSRPAVLSPLESDYTSRADENGWTTFDVRGAAGLSSPSALVWFLPLIFGGIGMNASLVGGLIGAVVGFILGFVYVSAQSSAIGALQGPRAPAGSFSVGPDGIKLVNGTLIPRQQVVHMGYRNIHDGKLLRSGTATLDRYSNTIFPISFQVEIESGGRAIPLVGCLNEATARGIFIEVKRLLDFVDTPQRS
jgi:hypothetical protein